ncbi:tricarboxylic transport [Salmonella enterica subsp. enterica]|uniref:Tricarboxylic transport n=1 Tax=Salmonella enterica I TaxID=59201 RepID=A0A447N582_SALET|nr:tricarboxylic transport [Salmonella enterica subsp. enterica]
MTAFILSDGVQFIVVVIGLFSVSEILLMLEHTSSGQTMVRKTGRMLFNLKEGAQCIGTTLRSSVIGFFVGVLPGAGATIASAITYMTEKKLSGNSDSFGKGDIRGVAAPEAANNASACGSFIPMLTLGVPGSGTTAVMMGALTLYNITPGPAMFTEQPDIVWGLIAALLIANVMLLIMNIPLTRSVHPYAHHSAVVPGTRHRCRIGGRGVCGTQHHLRSGADGRARRVRGTFYVKCTSPCHR